MSVSVVSWEQVDVRAASDALVVAARAGLVPQRVPDVLANGTDPVPLIFEHRSVLSRFGFTIPDRLPTSPAVTVYGGADINFDAARDALVVTGTIDPTVMDQIKIDSPGCRWDPKARELVVPSSQAHGLEFLVNQSLWRFTDPARAAVVLARQRAERDIELSRSIDSPTTPTIPGLNPDMTLRPFQLSAVEYLVAKRSGFDCDPPGLGKTVTALSAVAVLGAYPVVVCTKAKLRLNWGREVETWFPGLTYTIAEGRKSTDLTGFDVVIVNYDIIQYRLDDLLAVSPRALVNDESHYVKERAVTDSRMEKYRSERDAGRKPKRPPGSQRTWALKRLATHVRVSGGAVFNLTATPRPNRNRELWPQIEIAGMSNDFGGWKRFARRYCDLKKVYGREDADGSTNKTELNRKLREMGMVARRKSDVLPQLPALMHNTLEVVLDPKVLRDYRKAEADIVKFLADRAAAEAVDTGSDPAKAAWLAKLKAEFAKELNELTQLRQLAARAKIDGIVDWLTTYIEDNPTDDLGDPTKFVVFAHHRDIQTELRTKLPDAAAIASSDIQTDREAEADKARFMTNPDCRYIVIGPGAMEGHTLTAAQHVVLAELPWNEAAVEQIAGRCIASGQLVTTKRGQVPIEDVVVGDVVLTHKGNWKPVTATYEREEKNLVEVDAARVAYPLVCTPDHLLWVKGPDGQIGWKEAGKLSIGDLVATPRPIPGRSSPVIEVPDRMQQINHAKRLCQECHERPTLARNLCQRCYSRHQSNPAKYGPLPPKTVRLASNKHVLPETVEVDSQLLWAIGRFLGDGWVKTEKSNGKNVHKGIGICGHVNEFEDVQKALYSISGAFGLPEPQAKVLQRTSTGSIASSTLGDLFDLLFLNYERIGYRKGSQGATKRVPDTFWPLPTDLAWSLLTGYISADGGWKDGRWRWTTVGDHLAYQSFLLAAQCGFEPSILHSLRRSRGSDSKQARLRRDVWEVSVPVRSDLRRKFDLRLSDDDHVWHPVRYLRPYEGPVDVVHDLTVEDDHSFVVGGVAVHNSYGRLNNPRPVTLHWMMSKDTIDQTVYTMIQRKGAGEEIVVHGSSDSEFADETVETSVLFDLLDRA